MQTSRAISTAPQFEDLLNGGFIDDPLKEDLVIARHVRRTSTPPPYRLAVRSGSTPPWVARITGPSQRYGLAREFLSRTGTIYELAEGMYEVQQGDGPREYLLVAGQRVQRIEKEDVWSLIRVPAS